MTAPPRPVPASPVLTAPFRLLLLLWLAALIGMYLWHANDLLARARHAAEPPPAPAAPAAPPTTASEVQVALYAEQVKVYTQQVAVYQAQLSARNTPPLVTAYDKTLNASLGDQFGAFAAALVGVVFAGAGARALEALARPQAAGPSGRSFPESLPGTSGEQIPPPPATTIQNVL
ncbi:hypothetical protein DEIPH_ctg017orf0003 [Deinococcus phoenicis]|uniref:Uncharacterized protein n=1 Tax=Deinococcus phoenicis TaxID=1476583 RepID=A0A016QRB7_9DEIO|nr:hypothetical protein [Deinococcus phoenicis]EYB68680.1 hypothetical protein DEIPH_ctg017orf0003 [Deinococcus phoenicis]